MLVIQPGSLTMSSSRVIELVLAGRASECLGTAARTWPRLRRATGPYLSPLTFDLRGMARIWKSRICRVRSCRCIRQLFCGHVSQGSSRCSWSASQGRKKFTTSLHLLYFFDAIWCRRVHAAVGLLATASIDHPNTPTRCSCAACNKTLCSVYKTVSHISRHT